MTGLDSDALLAAVSALARESTYSVLTWDECMDAAKLAITAYLATLTPAPVPALNTSGEPVRNTGGIKHEEAPVGEPIAWTNQHTLDVRAMKGADTPYEQSVWSDKSPDHNIARYTKPQSVPDWNEIVGGLREDYATIRKWSGSALVAGELKGKDRDDGLASLYIDLCILGNSVSYYAAKLEPFAGDRAPAPGWNDAIEAAAKCCEGDFDNEMRGYGEFFAKRIRALKHGSE